VASEAMASGEAVAVAVVPTPAAPLPLVDSHGGERFIPVSRTALLAALSRPEVWPQLGGASAEAFFALLNAWRHLSYMAPAASLFDVYNRFNPDRDTVLEKAGEATAPGDMARLLGDLRALLERANFDEITREDLPAVIAEENPYGLVLDAHLEEFDDLVVFVRGLNSQVADRDRLSRAVFGSKSVELVEYDRVFVALKLKSEDARVAELIASGINERRARRRIRAIRGFLPPGISSEYIYLKLFKNIPRADIEMLFPTTRVRLRGRDRLTLGVTAGGGIGVGVASVATKIVAAAMTPIGAGLAVVGLAGAASQQFARMIQMRSRYLIEIAQSLYFKNLANNAGVIAVLVQRGEEEDVKEEALLYTALAYAPARRTELAEVKRAIEGWLRDTFGVHVMFDIEDALGRLMRDGLVRDDAGTLRALPMAEATARLEALWGGWRKEPDGG
jgi:Protein of unknown function (DUF3754)